MSEFEPRYVLSFRSGTPEMIVVGVCTVLGAAFVVLFAYVVREFVCAEASSECSSGALVQLVIACVGLIPALGTLVASARRRGHPWRWFLVTVISYAFWALFPLSVFG